ncbi:uncharacterized protein LOC144157587 [Haemaphysalis longicornis]
MEESSTDQSSAKRRKRYLLPGAKYVLPRSTLRYQRQVANGSSRQVGNGSSTSTAPTTHTAPQGSFLSHDQGAEPDDMCEFSEMYDSDGEHGGEYSAGDRCPGEGYNDLSDCDVADFASGFEHCSDESDSESDECGEPADDFFSLFTEECLPNSDITIREAMMTLMAFSSSAGLNWTDMEKLVTMVNLFLGKDVLPTSKFLLRKVWRKLKTDVVKEHYFCQECGFKFPSTNVGDLTCPKCSSVSSRQNAFAILDIKKQMEVALSSKTVARGLLTSLRQRQCKAAETVMTDLSDGHLNQKVMKDASPHDLSLTFNTDMASSHSGGNRPASQMTL